MSEQATPSFDVADWLFPAGTFPTPTTAFVGAQYGAGTSTWAALLAGTDCALDMPETGVVVGVCRSTPAGITAAKTMIGHYGPDRFKAFLVVADAPAKMLPQAAREVKVLSAAVPVVVVPWIVKLRGVELPTGVAADLQRHVSRVREKLAAAAVRVPKEFQTQPNRKAK